MSSESSPDATNVLIRAWMMGVTPLLQDRMSEEDILAGRFEQPDGTKKRRGKKAVEAATTEDDVTDAHPPAAPARRPTAAELCLPKLNLHDGKPVIPAEHFYRCLITAGQHVAYKKGKVTGKNGATALPSFLSIEDEFLFVRTPVRDGRNYLTGLGETATWEPDIRKGKLRSPNKRTIIRPKFKHWGFAVTLQADLETVTIATVRELVNVAGNLVGIGSFRPEFRLEGQRGTFFGQFRVMGWDVSPIAE